MGCRPDSDAVVLFPHHPCHHSFPLHTGAGVTYQDTKDSIARLLSEFEASRDAEEAARCLRGLNVPFFHHEVRS